MKVKEIIELLQKFDGELEVINYESELNEYYPVTDEFSFKREKVYPTEGGYVLLEDAPVDYDNNNIVDALII